MLAVCVTEFQHHKKKTLLFQKHHVILQIYVDWLIFMKSSYSIVQLAFP